MMVFVWQSFKIFIVCYFNYTKCMPEPTCKHTHHRCTLSLCCAYCIQFWAQYVCDAFYSALRNSLKYLLQDIPCSGKLVDLTLLIYTVVRIWKFKDGIFEILVAVWGWKLYTTNSLNIELIHVFFWLKWEKYSRR